jgi:hypothetical protein
MAALGVSGHRSADADFGVVRMCPKDDNPFLQCLPLF